MSSFNILISILFFFRFHFDFLATYVGVGVICPYIITISLLTGSILSWGIMWPLITRKKGIWYSEELSDNDLSGLQGYKVLKNQPFFSTTD